MADDIKVLVTDRPGTPEETVLATPGSAQNVEVVTMRWWTQVLVRVARTYLQSLVGFLGAAQVSGTVKNLAVDAFGNELYMAMSLAVAPAVISLIQNAIELLTQLDASNPKLRG